MTDAELDAHVARLVGEQRERTLPVTLRMPESLLERTTRAGAAEAAPYQSLTKRLLHSSPSRWERSRSRAATFDPQRGSARRRGPRAGRAPPPSRVVEAGLPGTVGRGPPRAEAASGPRPRPAPTGAPRAGPPTSSPARPWCSRGSARATRRRERPFGWATVSPSRGVPLHPASLVLAAVEIRTLHRMARRPTSSQRATPRARVGPDGGDRNARSPPDQDPSNCAESFLSRSAPTTRSSPRQCGARMSPANPRSGVRHRHRHAPQRPRPHPRLRGRHRAGRAAPPAVASPPACPCRPAPGCRERHRLRLSPPRALVRRPHGLDLRRGGPSLRRVAVDRLGERLAPHSGVTAAEALPSFCRQAGSPGTVLRRELNS